MNKMSLSPSRLPPLGEINIELGSPEGQACMEAAAFPSHSTPACTYLQIQFLSRKLNCFHEI